MFARFFNKKSLVQLKDLGCLLSLQLICFQISHPRNLKLMFLQDGKTNHEPNSFQQPGLKSWAYA